MLKEGSSSLKRARFLLLSIYVILVLSPVIMRTVLGIPGGFSLIHEAGLLLGLTGFAMLMLQPVIASRAGWLEHPFGLDRLIRFHRGTGIAAVILLILHPVLLAVSFGSSRLLLAMDLPWFLLIARATLLVMVLFGAAAAFRAGLRIPFQLWFRMHSGLTPLLMAGAFLHSYFIAISGNPLPMRLLWFVLLGLGLFSWLHLVLVKRLGGRLKAFTVTDVRQIAERVWNITLEAPGGGSGIDYLPGQFLFITLLRGRGLPAEEHPFTISSSPSRGASLSITPKELGDYTTTLGETKKGDRAAVMAPFGRFSHLLHDESGPLVFIAGGIGITPFISMLRFMEDSQNRPEVRLIYCSRDEGGIAFRRDIQAMEENGAWLRTTHVLSRPEPSWTGETGRLSRELLDRLLSEPASSRHFICGPPPMMNAAVSILKGMGVPEDRIHTERFAL